MSIADLACTEEESLAMDSFMNVVTGLGVEGKDASVNTFFGTPYLLPRHTLESMYVDDGIAANVVDVLADEMLCKGFEVVVADNKEVQDRINAEHKRLKTSTKVLEALKLARLHGGALVYPSMPEQVKELSTSRRHVTPINTLTILSRYQVTSWKRETNIHNSRYGEVITYQLGGDILAPSLQGRNVSATRFLKPFTGIPIPAVMQDRYSNLGSVGFGISVVQRAFAPIKNLVTSLQNLGALIGRYDQAAFSIKDLNQLLASPDGKKIVEQRLGMLQHSRSILNAIVLSEDESYEHSTIDVRGLSDVIDRFILWMSAVSRTPVTKLMGRSAAGENATGEGDDKNWTKTVVNEQEQQLREPLEQLTSLIITNLYGVDSGIEWSLKFHPLAEVPPLEEAQKRQADANTDSIYIAAGVLNEEEVRQSRFGGPEYGTEIAINEENAPFTIEGGEPEPPEDFSTPESSDEPLEVGNIPEDDLAKTALNGAQVTSLVEVITKVATGELPKEAAKQIILVSFPSVSSERADLMVQSASQMPTSPPSLEATENTTSAPSEPSNEQVVSNASLLPDDKRNIKDIASDLGVSNSVVIRAVKKRGIKVFALGNNRFVSNAAVEKMMAGIEEEVENSDTV